MNLDKGCKENALSNLYEIHRIWSKFAGVWNIESRIFEILAPGANIGMEEEGFDFKPWVSVLSGVMGVSLLGASFFVQPSHDAHALFFDIIRWIMVISGSLAVFAGVVTFFLRDSPDLYS